jgi:hypothetical protein
MRVAAAVAALILIAPPFVAEAGVPSPFMDGEELKEGLEAWESSWDSLLGDRTLDKGTAFGFVVGVADALDKDAFCLPVGLTRERLKDVVLKHLREQPDLEDLRASGLTIAALRAEYPCKP